MSRALRLLLAATLAAAAPASVAMAQDSPVAATLVAERHEARPGEPLAIELRLVVREGWHIYSTEPGEIGFPTTVRWTLPANFAIGALRWPEPRRFATGAMTTPGYTGRTVARAELVPPSLPGEERTTIRAEVEWAACDDAGTVCIPGRATLHLTLGTTRTGPRAREPQ